MPWFVQSEADGCPASKPWGVMKGEGDDAELVECHPSKAAAKDQVDALYANESSSRSKPHLPSRGAREERVVHVADLEIRADEGAQPVITGHPLLYNVWSDDLGGFRERIKPGAVTKTLREADVRALFNHDPNYVLGRSKSGTLALTEQTKGLFMRVTPPETTWATDLITTMKRGDVDQMSFSFQAVRDEWKEPKTESDPWDRDVLEVRLFDVSVVTLPAYPQTDAQVRSALTGAGIDFDALASLLARVDRGLTPSASDIDLLKGSVAVLRSHIPPAPEPEGPTQATPDAGLFAHLRLLEFEAASL